MQLWLVVQVRSEPIMDDCSGDAKASITLGPQLSQKKRHTQEDIQPSPAASAPQIPPPSGFNPLFTANGPADAAALKRPLILAPPDLYAECVKLGTFMQAPNP